MGYYEKLSDKAIINNINDDDFFVGVKKNDEGKDIVVRYPTKRVIAAASAVKFSLSNIVLEQGGINTSGKNTNAKNRIRTKYALIGETFINLPKGFLISRIAYTDKEGIVKVINVDAQSCTIFEGEYSNCQRAVFDIKKEGDTEEFPLSITTADLKAHLATEKIDSKVDQLTLNLLMLEQGAITKDTGALSDNSKRVRTSDYIYGKCSIGVPEGYCIFLVAYYSKDTDDFYTAIQLSDGNSIANTAEIGMDGYKAKVVFAAANITDDIAPEDLQNIRSVSDLKTRINKSVDYAKQLTLEFIRLEQGGIQKADGVLVDNSKRVRTADFIFGYHEISVPKGYCTFLIVYYDEVTGIFDSSFMPTTNSVKVGKDSCKAKVVFAAENTADELTVEDFQNKLQNFGLSERMNAISSTAERAQAKAESAAGLAQNAVELSSMNTLSGIVLESGKIHSNGKKRVSENRIRSKYPLTGKAFISLPQDFLIDRIAYTDSEGNIEVITAGAQSYTVFKEGCTALFDIRKTDNTAFTEKDIKNHLAFEDMDRSISQLSVDMLRLEQGSIQKADGLLIQSDIRVRTKDFIYGKYMAKVPEGYCIFLASYYSEETGIFDSSVQLSDGFNITNSALIGKEGCKAKLVFAAVNAADTVTPEALQSIRTISDLEKRVSTLEIIPSFDFTYDHDLADISDQLSSMDLTSGKLMAQVYAKFDGLVSDFPGYVSRSDAAIETGLDYPSYAGDYRTYVYKFADTNLPSAGGVVKKQKLLLLGGVHGDEPAAPVNLYLFMNRLCRETLNDPNLFKLRTTHDIYVVPCVNGYGMLNSQRKNGNGVNINRNYPTSQWTASSDASDRDYSGAAAGDQFETQLIMELVRTIEPDLTIDHHAYGLDGRQFYVIPGSKEELPYVLRSYTDCSIAFKKSLPEYFGDSYGLVGGGIDIATAKSGQISKWINEQGRIGIIVEVSCCINYKDGAVSADRIDWLGSDALSVAEYTLRNQILRYAQYAAERGSEA